MRRNKYRAREVIAFGRRFASRAECARYIVLADMQDRGEISQLTCQPSYDLPAGITYRADYAYVAHTKAGDVQVVEDVKGFETAAFRLKKRLFEERYKIPLQIIKMKSRDVNALLAAFKIV